jgi:hypothetical protein
LQAADARDRARGCRILSIMLILSKKKFAARTALQVECRPELRSGGMKNAPVYKTGLQEQAQMNKHRFAGCCRVPAGCLVRS